MKEPSDIPADKLSRLIGIYTKLLKGAVVNKAEEAKRYSVHERSIQRDIDALRLCLADASSFGETMNEIVYDRAVKGFRLREIYKEKLTNGEVLSVCKILLDSRAFPKKVMKNILAKLLASSVPKYEHKQIAELIKSEEFHYVEPRHGKDFLDDIWRIGQAIRSCNYISISYQRSTDKKIVERKLKPVAIMFSEFYFYLAAIIDDDPELAKAIIEYGDAFPTIYRLDRIKRLVVLDEKFHIPYSERFEEGEFRKRVQFMFSGFLRRIKFRYYGRDITLVLDRLPTAKVLDEADGVYTVSVEVYGDGIDFWLRGMGDSVEVLEDN